MGVYEEIFPSERRREYAQTEWAVGWAAAAAGFGFAAEQLTKNATSLGATVDQAGLAIFFLQRHRVELILKDLLVALEVEFPPTHSLSRLWELCQTGFEKNGALSWQKFEPDHAEFIEALSKVDDGAANFRFPVDRSGKEVSRPEFIDLAALNRHADELYWSIYGCINGLGELATLEAEAEGEG
jgi:hypothetical protein